MEDKKNYAVVVLGVSLFRKYRQVYIYTHISLLLCGFARAPYKIIIIETFSKILYIVCYNISLNVTILSYGSS